LGRLLINNCYENWLKLEKVYTTLPSVVCWYIWLERNRCIFENCSPTVQGVGIKIRGMVKISSGQTLQKRIYKRNKKTPDITLASSCWFDGAAQENGILSGAGGIIKISGNTIYRWTFNCGMGTNTRAELLGVWASLSLAHRLDIDHLHVLGDSKIVIDWLNYKTIYK
jgi:hypothetical protein